ncbi:mPR-like GPCR protein [Fusarium redolens]|uniref:MPR-like GPCR protein n=1 Tax=Fusarium redolens TaxID=48865 RepID=A0A9P9GZ98_FUSRE|nr:mPR-like GPCR protein [Fusarium redolens]KAH7247415.1 mPR-like GPCR protein [Fusarium redolens]
MGTSRSAPQDVALRQRYPSGAGLSTESINTGKVIENKAEKALLLWDDLPAWRRDNAFIHSGYCRIRPTYLHSLRSLFNLHNESVNIWSHLLGAIVAVACSLYLYYVIRPRHDFATLSDVLVFTCFIGGAGLCLGMSATFHAVLNHSQKVARWGNKLDYTGIIVLIVGSFVPALYYGFFCMPTLLTAYLCLICLLGTGCAIISWVEQFRTPRWRPYRAMMFAGLGLSGFIPIIHGVAIYGYKGLDDRISVTWIIIHGAMYLFGAVLYVARWPERSFPGAFDIWGSSHQIFHMFVLLAAATHFYGMMRAFDYHHTVLGSQCLTE